MFYSPGTFFAERSMRPIESRDCAKAVAMAEEIVERHGARPYGFVFETQLVADPVPDGRGGTLNVEPKKIRGSGMHFLGGRLETLDEVEKRNDPSERIKCSNMRANDSCIVCINEKTYRSTQPFTESDVIVSATGRIVERGDDPRHVAYRIAVRRRLDAEQTITG